VVSLYGQYARALTFPEFLPGGDSGGGVSVEAMESEEAACWRKDILKEDDSALVLLYTHGARAAVDLKELLFLRDVDPVRYLDVTMKIKAERSKTAEEEEQLRIEAARRDQVSAAAAEKAKLMTSRQARLERGIVLRQQLQQYPEESIPKLGEGLKDYYARTQGYWTLTAHELLESTGTRPRPKTTHTLVFLSSLSPPPPPPPLALATHSPQAPPPLSLIFSLFPSRTHERAFRYLILPFGLVVYLLFVISLSVVQH